MGYDARGRRVSTALTAAAEVCAVGFAITLANGYTLWSRPDTAKGKPVCRFGLRKVRRPPE
jgi:hypothetical protein